MSQENNWYKKFDRKSDKDGFKKNYAKPKGGYGSTNVVNSRDRIRYTAPNQVTLQSMKQLNQNPSVEAVLAWYDPGKQ